MFKRIILWVVLFAVAIYTSYSPVLAFDNNKEVFEKNDILFYNKDDVTCSGVSSSGVSGSDNQEKIWGFLKSNGLSDEQVAGVMGNIFAESSFSPTRHEDGQPFSEGGWGLVQWTFGRRTNLIKRLGEKHPDLLQYHSPSYGGAPNDKGVPDGLPIEANDKLLIFELQYMIEESKNRATREGFANAGSEWESLKLTKTIEEAAVFWHDNFERSAQTPSEVIEKRGGTAKNLFNRFKGQGGSERCTSGVNGDIQSFVKKYAWPDYKPGRTERKPEYAHAVEETKKRGGYYGDTCYGGGVDCGGFVTILMRDSGWDANYNNGNSYTGFCGVTGSQADYLCNNWQKIGTGDTINVADLRPGDVAMLPGHTFMYAGQMDGFEGVTAGASQCDYAPMASNESVTSSRVTWYRKK